MPRLSRIATCLGLGALFVLSNVGCGGSTPSSAVDGTTAAVAAAKGANGFTAASEISLLASLAIENRSRDPQYSEALGLYYTVSFPSTTQAHVTFSSEADGSGMNAGTLDLTITDGLPYPVIVHEVFDVTSRQTHITGSMDTTLYDSGLNHVGAQGNYRTTRPTTSGVFALDYTSSAVTGQLALTVDPRTVVFTNIVYDNTGEFTANFAVQSTSGTVVKHASGSGSVTCTTDKGTFTLTWTADKTATIQLPDGSTKSLGNLANL